jgi:AraC family transcriptional regulator, transcriptional activator FtrA
MSALTRFLAYTAALLVPPVVVAALGLRALQDRERPPLLPPADARTSARAPRPAYDPAKPTVVVLLGADVTEITDALGPFEMFARAGRFNVLMVAPERRPVLLSGGLAVLPHLSLTEADALLGGRGPAIVVVPQIPNLARAENRPLLAWMRARASAGSTMFSWCTGARVLAAAGLLDGMTATAHWGDLPRLEREFPRVRWTRGVRWIDHGRIVTSAGITSGVDATLRVLRRVVGDSVARRVARELRYPNYRYAIDPAVEQYAIRPADAVFLANAAYRVARPRVGLALYDGVGELDVSNLYDTHAAGMAADVETVTEREDVVVTAHGLALLPSLALSGARGAARARRLDRLLVPGPAGRERAASLVAAAAAAAPVLRAEYLHADQPTRFGLEPVLEDLARTADAPTARFAQRRMEYRSAAVRLDGSGVAWHPLGVALALGLLGLSTAHGASRLLSERRPRRAVAVTLLMALASAAASAQSIDSLAAGTRIRADVFTPDTSRVRRIFAQPVAGALVGVSGDTLLLAVRDGADPLRIPRSALRDVYVSRGRPGRVASALRSAVVPALAGGAFRGLAGSMRRRDGDPSPGRAALTGAAVSAAVAGVKGAVFPKERWQRLTLPTGAARRPIHVVRK